MLQTSVVRYSAEVGRRVLQTSAEDDGKKCPDFCGYPLLWTPPEPRWTLNGQPQQNSNSNLYSKWQVITEKIWYVQLNKSEGVTQH